MLTWGVTGNSNRESWQSLGAHADGQLHQFTRYRTGADGASLHPLQRLGLVRADSHSMRVRMVAGQHPGIGDTRFAAAASPMTLPPVVPIASGQTHPQFRV